MPLRFDVFCRVVDNFGDAGVAWRLARQLEHEHAIETTLWIDAPASLARLAPAMDPNNEDQTIDGVRVRRLSETFDADALPDVVVEAFGCGLPDDYIAAMASAARPPVWVNLEYLSAEPWVEGTHGLPSPQPRLPLTRHFYFPGFTHSTGGLLRERDLLGARDAARMDPSARTSAWQAFGLDPPSPGVVAVSLFCYANDALPGLLDQWIEGEEPIACYVPEGVATPTLDAWTGGAVPHAGQSIVHGALTLTTVPFVSQDDYDRLLWHCDLNVVRGEDSFVRAQWAARPFVWHIYPQADDAHRVKLDEFLHRYLANLDGDASRAVGAFWNAWNEGDPRQAAAAWPAFRGAFPALDAHGRRWAGRLAGLPDLAGELVGFARDRL